MKRYGVKADLNGEIEMIKTLDQMVEAVKGRKIRKVAIAVAQDDDVLKAVHAAKEENIIIPVLVGDKDEIEKIATANGLDFSDTEMIDIKDKAEACNKAASLIKEGRADLLMKGFVDTSVVMRAVLNPENELLRGGLISHCVVLEVPGLDKLYYVTDAAMNIAPSLDDKEAIINNAVEVAHALHNELPNVAVLAAVEKVNPKMECTLDAQELTARNESGKIKGCTVYGPLALDNAVSLHAAQHKGITHPVAGNADILLAPDIEAANMLNKAMEHFAKAKKAGVIVGAKVPVILTSRATSAQSKMYSIALGALVAGYEGE